jgi:septal ring factor EnvC (AmiA/AmiB activator)
MKYGGVILKNITNPKFLAALGIVIFLFMYKSATNELRDQIEINYETQEQLLKETISQANQEIARLVEYNTQTVNKISDLINQTNELNEELAARSDQYDKDFTKFAEKLELLDFQELAALNPDRAKLILTDEYMAILHCIEEATGAITPCEE